jgi:hypothetical protein
MVWATGRLHLQPGAGRVATFEAHAGVVKAHAVAIEAHESVRRSLPPLRAAR